MGQETYNLVSTIIAIISLVVTLIGLYAVYLQLKKLRENTWSSTHAILCQQSFDLIKLLNETPNSYGYFYHRKELIDDDPNKISVLYASEALANFLEHLMLQKENLPQQQWLVWERFIFSTFKNSVVVRQFIHDNREWYSNELLAVADECKLLYD